jgi:hypothetical protein
MPILFEELSSEVLYAEVANGQLKLSGTALAFAIEAEDSVVLGGFELTGAAYAEDEDTFFEPIVPALMEGDLSLSLTSSAYGIDYETVEGEFTLTGYGLSMAADEAMMPFGAFTLSGFAHAGNGVETSYSFLVEQPGIIFSESGLLITTGVEESLGFTTEPTATLDFIVQSILRMSDQPTVLAEFLATVTSSVQLRDSLALLIDSGVESTIDLADPVEADLRIIALIAEQLELSDEPTGTLSALQTVVSALVLADAYIPVIDGDLESEAVLAEVLEARIVALVEAVSALEATDEVTPSLHMVAFIEDELALTDEPSALLALLAELLDTANFLVRVDTGTARFAGYTMNLRNAAVTEYDNYNFNSFATVGGRAYGAGEDGVYRLEGEDDAGVPIDALVRTGILNLDSLSHVIKAWIGLTSDGQMVLKTITMDKGRKQENWYKMAARPQGTPVESRFSPAKGLTSTYWQWELANVDGAYFEVDMLKVWPLSIGRRYSGR